MNKRMTQQQITDYINEVLELPVTSETPEEDSIEKRIKATTAPNAGSVYRLNESVNGPDVLEDIAKLAILTTIYSKKVRADAEDSADAAAASASTAENVAAGLQEIFSATPYYRGKMPNGSLNDAVINTLYMVSSDGEYTELPTNDFTGLLYTIGGNVKVQYGFAFANGEYWYRRYTGGAWNAWRRPEYQEDIVNQQLKTTDIISAYNCMPILAFKPIETSSYFDWDGYKCTVARATGENFQRCNVYYSTTALPSGIVAGHQYYLAIDSSNNSIVIDVYFYYAGGTSTSLKRNASGYIGVPANAVGMLIRVRIPANTDLTGETIIAALMAKPASNAELEHNISAIHQYSDALGFVPYLPLAGKNDTSFTWDGYICEVSRAGGKTTTAFTNLYEDTGNLPYGLSAGNTYYIKLNTDADGFGVRYFLYDGNGDVIKTVYTDKPTEMVLPSQTVGMIFRAEIPANEDPVAGHMIVGISKYAHGGDYSDDIAELAGYGKMFVKANSILVGSVHKYKESTGTVRYDHLAKWGNAPYSVVCKKIGVSKTGVNNNILLSSTGLMYRATDWVAQEGQPTGSFLDNIIGGTFTQNDQTITIAPADLSHYDYVMTHFWINDLNLCPIGSAADAAVTDEALSDYTAAKQAGTLTLVGGVKRLMQYLANNYPHCRLVLVSVPPVDTSIAIGGDPFAKSYTGSGVSQTITQLDNVMHTVAASEKFVYIDWQDLKLSHYYQQYTGATINGTKLNNVHANNENTYRQMGQYLAEHL